MSTAINQIASPAVRHANASRLLHITLLLAHPASYVLSVCLQLIHPLVPPTVQHLQVSHCCMIQPYLSLTVVALTEASFISCFVLMYQIS